MNDDLSTSSVMMNRTFIEAKPKKRASADCRLQDCGGILYPIWDTYSEGVRSDDGTSCTGYSLVKRFGTSKTDFGHTTALKLGGRLRFILVYLNWCRHGREEG